MSKHTYQGLINVLKPNDVFVFGSNPEGRHGMGAAKIAREKFGAEYGIGRGLQGQSYALITKNLKKDYYEQGTGIRYEKYGKRSIDTKMLLENIRELYNCAISNSNKNFFIAYTGGNDKKNLSGYSNNELAKLFAIYQIPDNIIFEKEFNELVKNNIETLFVN